MSNFMKIFPVRTEFCHADRHDDSNSAFRSFASAPNNKTGMILTTLYIYVYIYIYYKLFQIVRFTSGVIC